MRYADMMQSIPSRFVSIFEAEAPMVVVLPVRWCVVAWKGPWHVTNCDPPLPPISIYKHVSLVCRYFGSVGLSETENLSRAHLHLPRAQWAWWWKRSAGWTHSLQRIQSRRWQAFCALLWLLCRHTKQIKGILKYGWVARTILTYGTSIDYRFSVLSMLIQTHSGQQKEDIATVYEFPKTAPCRCAEVLPAVGIRGLPVFGVWKYPRSVSLWVSRPESCAWSGSCLAHEAPKSENPADWIMDIIVRRQDLPGLPFFQWQPW